MANGADDFLAAITVVDAQMLELTPVAVGRGAEHIRAVAAELTPVLTGHLVGSAGVTVKGDEAEVLYPGPYARYQHYGLDFRHTKGQALYLEQPMVTEAQKVLRIIADTLGGAF